MNCRLHCVCLGLMAFGQLAVAAPANRGDDPIDRFRFSSSTRAGYDWWSLQPLEKRDPPETQNQHGPQNEIDRFILAKLNSKGLAPSPRADPRALVRRVYFDLIGLPARPETIERFADNPSQKHWEQLVVHLLASKHYGERWARHWLDVARFGESHGYEYNAPRKAAWHYRDWVIRSLNQDLPYNQFAKMQLAGDIIKPDSLEGLAAVGFLVAGVHNTVLGNNPTMKLAARQDELEEMAGTVAQTFLGLTVNCARCHDHKFDPISTQEYYQFIAALDGVTHGLRNGRTQPASTDDLNELERNKEALQRHLMQLVSSRNGHVSSAANQVELKVPIHANRKGVKYRVSMNIAPTVWASSDQATSDRDGLVVRVVREDGRIVATHHMKPGAWNRGQNAAKFTEQSFTYAGTGAGSVRIQIGPYPLSSNRFGGAVDDLTISDAEHVIFEDRFDQLTQNHPPGRQADTRRRVFYGASSVTWAHLGTHAIHAVEHAKGNFALQFYSGNANGTVVQAETAAEKAIQKQIDATTRQAGKIHAKRTTPVYTVVPSTPGTMRVHLRGSVTNLGDEVEPGGLMAVRNLSPSFGASRLNSDSQRRRKLAEWICHPNNGPFHRVIVNRVWHYHFGRGLVDSPSDLGFNGGRPSHPALLNWLAVWFRDHGYSLKKLHHLILTSLTYQQSSLVTLNPSHSAAMGIDQNNLLLWRQNARRINAEVFRDSILEFAGALNRERFGPGFKDVKVETVGSAHYYIAMDPVGEPFNRRTIYRWQVRGQRSALLDTFDCPDPSTATPVRNVTTTPSQALSQWNHPFILRMSGRFAQRVGREAGPDIAKQIKRAYRLVLGRDPDDEEAGLAGKLVKENGLALFARVLFNCNESIWIE